MPVVVTGTLVVVVVVVVLAVMIEYVASIPVIVVMVRPMVVTGALVPVLSCSEACQTLVGWWPCRQRLWECLGMVPNDIQLVC